MAVLLPLSLRRRSRISHDWSVCSRDHDLCVWESEHWWISCSSTHTLHTGNASHCLCAAQILTESYQRDRNALWRQWLKKIYFNNAIWCIVHLLRLEIQHCYAGPQNCFVYIETNNFWEGIVIGKKKEKKLMNLILYFYASQEQVYLQSQKSRKEGCANSWRYVCY